MLFLKQNFIVIGTTHGSKVLSQLAFCFRNPNTEFSAKWPMFLHFEIKLGLLRRRQSLISKVSDWARLRIEGLNRGSEGKVGVKNSDQGLGRKLCGFIVLLGMQRGICAGECRWNWSASVWQRLRGQERSLKSLEHCTRAVLEEECYNNYLIRMHVPLGKRSHLLHRKRAYSFQSVLHDDL